MKGEYMKAKVIPIGEDDEDLYAEELEDSLNAALKELKDYYVTYLSKKKKSSYKHKDEYEED
jgi:hypothetical protein